jgi:hypothetical protein
MRKITLSLFGIAILFGSCQKKDLKTAEEQIATPEQTSGRICASDEVLQAQIADNPSRGKFLERLEEYTETYKGRSQGINFRADQTLYVPVVLHIVLPDPNVVSDAQIKSQFDVLKKDFSKTNSELSSSSVYLAGYDYNAVANCKVEYYVSDIVRKATTVSSFGTNDAVKKTSSGGSDPIDPTTKMNFWVCDLSSGYLGYAQFPGGSASTDGVVIDYQAFGTTASYPMYASFNLGRTATHEIGHWVNLRHIWGDRRCGTDYVNDTPAHDGSNGGCPSTTSRSMCTGRPLEQWMNYMDYTDDRCMYMFSGGQKTRMDAAIDGARISYFSTTAPATRLF